MILIRKLKNLIGIRLGRNLIKIDYDKKRDRLKVNCPPCFQDRTIKTVELFMMAFEYAKNKLNGDLHLAICCEDYPSNKYHTKRKILSYTALNENKNIILIPDFIFMNWKECGIPDYSEITEQLCSLSAKDCEYNTLFWIGNAKTHYTRETLLELSEKDNRIEAYATGWDSKNSKVLNTKYVSIPDHTKYKYLIDIQGNGYSGRIKMLMFTGRPLFIADRKWIEFWTNDVKPFVHYIPVKEDLSDLIEMLDWAEKNEEKCKEIAKNAQVFAKENLTREAAVKYITNTLIELSK